MCEFVVIKSGFWPPIDFHYFHSSLIKAVQVHKTMKISLVSLFLAYLSLSEAFVVRHHAPAGTASSTLFVGGKGWENSGYLDSLGGDDDDREQSKQDYQEFHETRQAFLKRQEERMKTPEAQRFLQQQQQRNEQSWQQAQDEADFPMMGDDEFEDLGASSGGSRFKQMMQKSKQMQQRMQPKSMFVDPSTGLEQKFVVPLDDDSDMTN